MAGDFFLGYDVGTGGTKAALIDRSANIIASSFCEYPLYHPKPRWAEQDPEDWWQAVVTCTREVLARSDIEPGSVAGLGFAGQMLGLVPMRADGSPQGMAVSWMDSRGDAQAARIIHTLGGKRPIEMVAGGVPTGKDVIAKMLWFKEERPDDFAVISKFLDTTGYLVFRATGRMVVDHTGAGGTGLIGMRSRDWSRSLFRLVRMPLEKLPPVLSSIEVAGLLGEKPASAMGLAPGTPVIAGMADIPAAATGSGALEHGDGHIYLGTSSWLCLSVRKPKSLGKVGIASVPSPDPNLFMMIGESEMAGACMDWFLRELAREKSEQAESTGHNLYALLDERIEAAEPGARNLIFTPWMFGERSPVADTTLHGAFLNLGLEHRQEDLMRAIYEGVAYNLRWLLEAVEKAGYPCPALRAIGGGAQSDTWMQVIADVTGRRMDAVSDPQQAGAVGCALAVAVALGVLNDYKEIKRVVRVRRSFEPRSELRPRYDRLFRVFQDTYPALSRAGLALNRDADR